MELHLHPRRNIFSGIFNQGLDWEWDRIDCPGRLLILESGWSAPFMVFLDLSTAFNILDHVILLDTCKGSCWRLYHLFYTYEMF